MKPTAKAPPTEDTDPPPVKKVRGGLYVRWAVRHILVVNRCLSLLYAENNINMLEVCGALEAERNRLIDSSPEFAEADNLLDEIQPFLKKRYRHLTRAAIRHQQTALEDVEVK